MKPLVSAIVTSYNHARYLERALSSALSQDLDELEVIAIDDASTDGSREILQRFAGAPGLELALHEQNCGVSASFNDGLERARGSFVAFLGSDDYWQPDHLRGAVETLRIGDTALCYGRVRVVDADGRDISAREPLFDSAPDESFFDELLVRSNFVPFISCVFRRDVALAVGGFDPTLETLQDYDLWLRISAAHPVRFLDRTTAEFRWHGANTSGRSRLNSVRTRRELAAILERWLGERRPELARRGLEAATRRRLADTYVRLARRVPDRTQRARWYRRSLQLNPLQPTTLARLLLCPVERILGIGSTTASAVGSSNRVW